MSTEVMLVGKDPYSDLIGFNTEEKHDYCAGLTAANYLVTTGTGVTAQSVTNNQA